jgi:RNA polymerase sigma factor (TIGR02999 family)
MTSHSELPPGALTRYLRRWRAGDDAAFDHLLPHVYEHLRTLARGRLRGEREGHTLDTTALVHEAYLRLVDGAVVDWQDRGHFFAVASRAMRRILVDHAKERGAKKRGGGWVAVELDPARLGAVLAVPGGEPDLLLALDEALVQLEAEHPRQARAIEFRYFGGLTLDEIGECQGTSAPTAMRDLRFAQAWLARALTSE